MRVVQVSLRTTDLDRATDFYRMLTGSEPVARFDPPGLVFFDLDGVRLLISPNGSQSLIYLHVDSVRDTLARLRSAGVEVNTEPHVIFAHEDDSLGPAGTDEWQGFITDTEGNLVGLVSHEPQA